MAKKYTYDFLDDKEKMRDFYILTKKQFLESYSYLTEKEYNATKRALAKKGDTHGKNIQSKSI